MAGGRAPARHDPRHRQHEHHKFEPDIRTFLERWIMEGATHHSALGVGHVADKIELLARCLGIEYVLVKPSG